MTNMSIGVNFMIIGMSVVFVFLVVMIISMNILKIVITQFNKIYPEKEDTVQQPAAADNTQEIAAAIAAAYSMKK
ncbi:MAG: OadG family transporter subunit [Spirochaetota bacterium]